MASAGSGGFLPTTPQSPAASPSAIPRAGLPHPRSSALRSGSVKEDTTRRYIESRLLHVSRRYTKKFQPPEPGETLHGYDNMRDVCQDLGEIVDVLWLSGTPSLQIPYLMNIALAVSTYITAFPPAPPQTFSLLRKLDYAFSSLLQGEDVESGELLPGFASGATAGMSRTDMVRCKSLVETTRVQVVEVMSGRDADMSSRTDADDTANDTDGVETDTDTNADVMLVDDWDEDPLAMNVAKVYEKTLMKLGEVLGEASSFQVESGS